MNNSKSLHSNYSFKAFLDDIALVQDAAQFCSIHYVGRLHEQEISLEKARLRVHNVNPIAERRYAAGDIAAGVFGIDEYGISLTDAIGQLASGVFNSPHGKLVLNTDDLQDISIKYDDMHIEGIQNQNRLSVLTVVGSESYFHTRQSSVDWKLRSSINPYFTLQELLSDFGCGVILDGRSSIEIIADNILFIDPQSILNGDMANVWLRMDRHLDTSKVLLGFRSLLNGTVIERRSLAGSEFEWANHEGILRGAITFDVSKGSILQCFASYDTVARHFYWVSDPSITQNPRRSVFELFDSNLDILQEFMSRQYRKGRDARDFETAISWLLWILGFSVSHLGQTEKTRDAADLIATTPKGDYAVVECTTGLLKSENKLSLLIERTSKVRNRLADCGNSHLRVLPVIVTSLGRDEVAADLEQAHKLGIVVVTREDITDILGRSLLTQDADKIYEEGLQSLQSINR